MQLGARSAEAVVLLFLGGVIASGGLALVGGVRRCGGCRRHEERKMTSNVAQMRHVEDPVAAI